MTGLQQLIGWTGPLFPILKKSSFFGFFVEVQSCHVTDRSSVYNIYNDLITLITLIVLGCRTI